MLDKPLIQVTYADIEQILKEQWPESKGIEYKRDLYGNKDDDKKELLKDVSSFANTDGGNILIGVDEDKGVPTAIPGVKVDEDKEKLRMEEIIRRGLEPQIDFEIHAVATPKGTTVLIIQIKESFLFPHRVNFHGKFGEFWARSSAGKYSMDTDQLRRAFTLSETVYERIRKFYQNRVFLIVKGQMPVTMEPGEKLILHLIPVASFRSRQHYEVRKFGTVNPIPFRPLSVESNAFNGRLNLDGYVSFDSNQPNVPNISWTQFYRNGVVEAVLSGIVGNQGGARVLYAAQVEGRLLQGLGQFLRGFQQLGVKPPLWGFLTVAGVKDAKIFMPREIPFQCTIDRDILDLPEFIIEDLNAKPELLLRPTFDLIWNAAGLTHSQNFDNAGEWKPRLM